MYFYPWALLWGVDFLGLSMLSWMSPFVMDGPAQEGMSQFMGRYIYPIFGAILVIGAFVKPHEAMQESTIMPLWLRLVLILWFAAEVYFYVRLRRQRRQWKGAACELSPYPDD